MVDNQGQINDADVSTMPNIPPREGNETSTETTATNENERYEAAQEAGGSENPANEAVGQEIPATETVDQSDNRTEQENRETSQANQAAAIAEFLNNNQ